MWHSAVGDNNREILVALGIPDQAIRGKRWGAILSIWDFRTLGEGMAVQQLFAAG
jgi:hypothetical protein